MSNLELTYQSFIERITDTGKKEIIVSLLGQLITVLLIFTILIFILTLLEALFGFNTSVRTFLFYFSISAFSASIVSVLLFSARSINKLRTAELISKYAKLIGSRIPKIKDKLINAVQIFRFTKENPSFYSGSLAESLIFQIKSETDSYDFIKTVSYDKIFKRAIVFALVLLFYISSLLIFPTSMLDAAYRLIDYQYTFIDNSLGITFEIKPGNAEITKGESIELDAFIKFSDPLYTTDKIILYTKEFSRDNIPLSSSEKEIVSTKQNHFKTVLNGITSDIEYWFEYKGVRSSSYKISVTNRPVIKVVKVTIYPPAYTKLPSRVVEGTDITTIFGSKIYVEVESSENVSKSSLLFGNNQLLMEVNGNNSSVSFNANGSSKFRIKISKEHNGVEIDNLNSPEFNLKVYPDEYPGISVIEPSQDYLLKGEKQVLINTKVTDDFGFSKVRIGYKLSKSKYGMADNDFRYKDVHIENKDATGLIVPYTFDLKDLHLAMEDEVEYFMEVYDNDAISGPKISRSQTHRLIYPSLEALLKKTEKSKDEIENTLQSAYENMLELQKEFDEIKDKLKENPEELSLNDPLKNQQLQNKLENLQNQLSSTQQKLDELMNDLRMNNQISKETLEKYMEIQKLFQKIDSKELREALQKLREAMKNFSKEQLQEAMKNFKFDEEAFKKSIEKTKELLNKILNEQKFGELTQKLDDITKKQDELKEQTKNTDEDDINKMNELSKTQEQIKNEYDEFRKQLQELLESMKKTHDKDFVKKMEEMLKNMNKKNTEQKMNQSSQNLQNSQKNSSQKQQQQISSELNQMNEQMQNLLSEMIDKENSKLQEKMQEILEQLQQMSQKQGDLMKESEQFDKNSPDSDYKKNKSEQEKLSQQLSETIDEIMSLSQQMGINPMMSKNLGDAYNNMNNASEQLSKKDGKSANQSQTDAKESLDKAIEKMQSMCKGNNGKSGRGSLSQLLQMLEQMIARQQALNQQMGQMSQQGNEGQYTQEQMAQMQKLSTEQETLRKNLQQLNEEFKKQQELEGKKLLGDLDYIQKEMLEVIKDLQNNNITPETRKRQEKILSRLLDFQLSAREKDFEQKRESRPGKNFDRSSPPEIVISKPTIIDGINQDALELQNEDYYDDYKLLIQKYKALLQKNRNK